MDKVFFPTFSKFYPDFILIFEDKIWIKFGQSEFLKNLDEIRIKYEYNVDEIKIKSGSNLYKIIDGILVLAP